MADSQLSSATHPLAKPGYGKRSIPDGRPASNSDFDHLPPREAAVAGYIDRLTDGSDMSVKTLAAYSAEYGQCAMRTVLRNLTAAGHLRRGLEHIVGSGSPRWVTRTWWSRTPRDDDWWAAFQRGEIPDERPPRRPTRSRAYILLAALSRTAPVMCLSHTECESLAPLVGEWFERGASEQTVLTALTAGLPNPVHHPAALARTRLTTKMPPERVTPVKPPLRVLECSRCGDPARPEALRDGECGPCRGEPVPTRATRPLPPAEVRAHAAQARAAAVRGGVTPEADGLSRSR
ncbi:hypothetical protein ACLGI4_16205 [Streptomyces sp. HMX112]|uniref:hypothetical protein n=1 Tax=Streptomyces sp. HMX112 TaxID=3390850 RepID=UPI003A7FC441